MALGNVGHTKNQDPHLQENNEKAELYIRVLCTRCKMMFY